MPGLELPGMVQEEAARPAARRRSRLKRTLRAALGVLAALLVVVALAFTLSPRPGSFVIRAVFERNAAQVKQTLETHAPSQGVTTLLDQPYATGSSATRLDVYVPD